jgi:hypothetical protein
MPEILGTVPCAAAVLDDGTLALYPEPGDALDQLRAFRRRVGAGRCAAKWETVHGASGATYDTLLVTLETSDEMTAVALLPPAATRQAVPPGRVHAALVLSELTDPTNPDLSAVDVLRFDAPALHSAS